MLEIAIPQTAPKHHSNGDAYRACRTGVCVPHVIDPANDQDGSAALWRAVINRAIEDARGKGVQGTPTERERTQAEAQRWLTVPNRGFIEVCVMADLEPDAVRRSHLCDGGHGGEGDREGRR